LRINSRFSLVAPNVHGGRLKAFADQAWLACDNELSAQEIFSIFKIFTLIMSTL
jgi:hypothetical protein